jgi:photosystem II stability/assembly factor-like uncharacterized protein
VIFIVALLSTASSLGVTNGAGAPGEPAALGPERGWIQAVAVSPSFGSDGHVWVATFGGGIFASQDGGASWASAHAGETDPVVAGLTVSPAYSIDHTVFAAADDGVFRSTDGGQSWSNISAGLRGHFIRRVELSPGYVSDHTIYAGTEAGVYRSQDAGATWTPPINGAIPIVSLVVAASGALFAGPSGGGLLTSSDRAKTWTTLPGFPASRSALDIAVSPGYPANGVLLVGTDSGLFVTHDGGSSWNTQLAAVLIPAVAISPAFMQDGVAFAGSAAGHGVYGTTDGGQTWGQLGGDPFVESLAVSPGFSTDHILFAGTAGRGVQISTDGGRSWAYHNAGLHAAEVAQLRVVSNLVGLAGNGGVSVRPVTGGAWQDLAVGTRFATAFGGAGQDLYVGTQDLGLLESHDAGTTWQASSLHASVSSIQVSPSYAVDRTVLVAAGYVYRSADAGKTWTQATGIVGNDLRRFGFSPAFDSDHTVFAATVVHGILVSHDGGITWTIASHGLPSDQISDVLVSPQFHVDNTAYAATDGDGVYVTHDGGATWAPLGSQPADGAVNALLQGPGGHLLAGTNKGVFELDTTGWQRLGGSWDDAVTDLDRAGAALYIATLGDGVWTLTLPDAPATATPTPTPTPTASPTLQATSTATPRPSPTATRVPPPPPRSLHPRIDVLPNPLVAAAISLVEVHGPPHGQVAMTLSSGSWRRSYASALPGDGTAAFGFLSPGRTMSLVAVFADKGLTATVRMSIPVRSARRARR